MHVLQTHLVLVLASVRGKAMGGVEPERMESGQGRTGRRRLWALAAISLCH